MTLEAMYQAAADTLADRTGFPPEQMYDDGKAAVDAALAEAKKVNIYTDGPGDWFVTGVETGVDEPGTYAIVGPL